MPGKRNRLRGENLGERRIAPQRRPQRATVTPELALL